MAKVRFYFDDGTNEYTFPLVYHISDPQEGMKATVIEGNRGDGSIVIDGGKKSQEITIRGKIMKEDGYFDINTEMGNMRTYVTTNVALLKIQHYNYGTSLWVDDKVYAVRRIGEIEFPESLRTLIQEYSVNFLVVSY